MTHAPDGAPTEVSTGAALDRAPRDAVAEAPDAVVYGEDVEPLGGVFRVTDGLSAEFGEVVAVGAPLVTVTPRIAQTSVPDAREGSGPVGGNGAADHAGSGPVLVGHGTGSGARTPRRRARGEDGPTRSTATGGPSTPPVGRVRVVSPLVRRLACEHGINAASVRGTGEGGLVPRRTSGSTNLWRESPVRPHRRAGSRQRVRSKAAVRVRN